VNEKIPSRERDPAIQALRAGVVPRAGIRHIQVGRKNEVGEVIKDVTRIAEGGSAVRFVVAEYGAGKTFFLSLALTVATEKKLVTMRADLSPDRRIHSTAGHARGLCADLIRSMATRTKPEGGALQSILERFIANEREKAAASGKTVTATIQASLEPIRDLGAGYDFAMVVCQYWAGVENDNEELKQAALRWLRAEYPLKSEANRALGVRTIVDDAGFYDHLKSMACMVRLAGYDGTLIALDEMVNLYKIANGLSRNANYEQLLRIVNDNLQGSSERIGFYFGATPEALMNSRRGIYSYEALRSRLAENTFARDGLVDLSGPVIRLQMLTPEELYVLLGNLRHLWAGGDPEKYLVPDEALEAFLNHCSRKVGESYFRTPRNSIKAFLDLLGLLEQNPEIKWTDLLETVTIAEDRPAADDEIFDAPGGPDTVEGGKAAEPAAAADDGLASFKL
jgi:hypothetical protein